jgi:hypothetical protein
MWALLRAAAAIVPGQVSTVTFPFTPTKTLPGLGEPVVMLVGGEPTLQYGPGAGGRAMSLTVTERPPAGPDAMSIVHTRSGRQVVIQATGGLDDQTLRDYVNGLVPDGFTVDNVMPSAVTFAPPGVRADAGFTGKIAVLLEEGSASGTDVTGGAADRRRAGPLRPRHQPHQHGRGRTRLT